MFRRFFLLFAIVPFLELWLLLELSRRTNWLTTVAVVILTGVIGISLVRWQGMSTVREIQQQLAAGKSPSRSIVSGVLILIAGAFLLTPGLITDTAGFVLLIPMVRNAIASKLQKHFISGVSSRFQSSVWVSGSAGPGFAEAFYAAQQAPPEAASGDSARPTVVVVEPDPPRIPK